MNVTVECSRCHNKVDGIIDDGVTGGFYNVKDGSGWELHANIDEEILCDTCMHQDYRYRAVYNGESFAADYIEEIIAMIPQGYTIRLYQHDGLFCVDITDGSYYDRHQEEVAQGKGATLQNACLNGYLQWMRWYDKRMTPR